MKSSGVNAAIYGIRGAGGVLVITTKKGTNKTKTDSSKIGNLLTVDPVFHLTKAFYSPKYNISDHRTGLDNRSTVYWNPEIITDKKGMAQVEYYNTDLPGNYRIIVEGISSNGYLCRKSFTYKVE
ncbi:hypothetical protein [Mucilaginibacter jinjuensis]|uniref:TonB-dependent SusC/RagA subfamily outer membrane receptor n=1 Tax=Mucilaginibacter jinjuensis TaxID=1176721 RepID=A0ABY7TEB8_9SPHI|nr:hypothetical protein [Mucilaginibacter jinjuensis]WCT14484.1 hypothetical protein PQO05_11125 [Mucilaginibacter jinjuensis]